MSKLITKYNISEIDLYKFGLVESKKKQGCSKIIENTLMN